MIHLFYLSKCVNPNNPLKFSEQFRIIVWQLIAAHRIAKMLSIIKKCLKYELQNSNFNREQKTLKKVLLNINLSKLTLITF